MPDQPAPVRWTPDRSEKLPPWPLPTMPVAMGRGFMCRCPSCGLTPVFDGYLTVVKECSNCHAPLGMARAGYGPTVDAAGSYSRDRASRNGFVSNPAVNPNYNL